MVTVCSFTVCCFFLLYSSLFTENGSIMFVSLQPLTVAVTRNKAFHRLSLYRINLKKSLNDTERRAASLGQMSLLF